MSAPLVPRGWAGSLTMTAVPEPRVSKVPGPGSRLMPAAEMLHFVLDDTLLVWSMHVAGSWRELGEGAWEPT
ncbi:MAG: hypothetical protein K0R44_3158 [Thermomicrobiales bacterium]|jgi:hypothetical protein|nr:hypothetical protein [Thermomicrobiales bacterium]